MLHDQAHPSTSDDDSVFANTIFNKLILSLLVLNALLGVASVVCLVLSHIFKSFRIKISYQRQFYFFVALLGFLRVGQFAVMGFHDQVFISGMTAVCLDCGCCFASFVIYMIFLSFWVEQYSILRNSTHGKEFKNFMGVDHIRQKVNKLFWALVILGGLVMIAFISLAFGLNVVDHPSKSYVASRMGTRIVSNIAVLIIFGVAILRARGSIFGSEVDMSPDTKNFLPNHFQHPETKIKLKKIAVFTVLFALLYTAFTAFDLFHVIFFYNSDYEYKKWIFTCVMLFLEVAVEIALILVFRPTLQWGQLKFLGYKSSCSEEGPNERSSLTFNLSLDEDNMRFNKLRTPTIVQV